MAARISANHRFFGCLVFLTVSIIIFGIMGLLAGGNWVHILQIIIILTTYFVVAGAYLYIKKQGGVKTWIQ